MVYFIKLELPDAPTEWEKGRKKALHVSQKTLVECLESQGSPRKKQSNDCFIKLCLERHRKPGDKEQF